MSLKLGYIGKTMSPKPKQINEINRKNPLLRIKKLSSKTYLILPFFNGIEMPTDV